MTKFLSVIVCALVLAGCSSLPQLTTMSWQSEPAGSLTVRGKEYLISKRTGRDRETNVVQVVEYGTTVDGHRVTCVGDINRCVAAIENALDNPMDEDDY